jgi:Domain of unknown function (DUF1874).
MSQTQKFSIDTYGSCRYSEVVVIYPEKIDLKKFTNRRGNHIVDLGLLKIKYRNYDSSKNLHRDIEIIEVKQPIVVRFFGASSCSKRFDEVFIVTPPNNVRKLAPEEIREELVTEENGKYRYRVLVRYIEIDGARVIIEKTVVEKEAIPEKLERIVFVGGLAPSMFSYRELLIRYKKISLDELRELAKDSEILNYIRHESTIKLLSSILNRDLTPNPGLYTWQEGDVLVVIGLKKPVRGQEVEVKADDLDIVLCKIEVVQ